MPRLLLLQALDYACYTRGARLFGPMPYMAIGHKGLRCYWMCIRRRRTSSRALEEHAEFSARLASRSLSKERPSLATRFSEKAEASREDAVVLRELLERSGESIIELP